MLRTVALLAAVAGCTSSSSPAPAAPAPVAPAPAADPQTLAAIEATALDYIQGWYAGDADRMARALHPALAKRMVHAEGGASQLDEMGAEKLIAGTRAGYGTDTPAERRLDDVTVLDVFGNAASVRVDASDWIDYLHVVKFDGRWVIINVLWELRPPPAPSGAAGASPAR
jgi:hypothetical protein